MAATKRAEKSKQQLPTKRGHPRKFKTEQEYQDAFMRYIAVCEERKELANIAGFCVYCDMTRETFYAQDNYYSDTHKKIQSALEDRAINFKANPAMSIFYLKNKFGYSDQGSQVDFSHIDVDFDAEEPEIDNLMSKLGYLPKPTDGQ